MRMLRAMCVFLYRTCAVDGEEVLPAQELYRIGPGSPTQRMGRITYVLEIAFAGDEVGVEGAGEFGW